MEAVTQIVIINIILAICLICAFLRMYVFFHSYLYNII